MNVFVCPLIMIVQIIKRCEGLNSASTLKSATVLEEARFVAYMLVGVTEGFHVK